MSNISVDNSKVEKLITEVIQLEKEFMHNKSMLEREKRAKIKELIEKEVVVDAN